MMATAETEACESGRPGVWKQGARQILPQLHSASRRDRSAERPAAHTTSVAPARASQPPAAGSKMADVPSRGPGSASRLLKAATMTPARAAAYLGGATLLVAWLASAAGVSRVQSAARRARVLRLRPARRRRRRRPVAGRRGCATRLAAAPAPTRSRRNPFTFAMRAAGRAPSRRRRRCTAGSPAADRPSPTGHWS